MIDGKNFFDHPVKNYLGKYDNIRKIASDQEDNYTTGCLLDYPYFKKYYKMIALDVDPKAIQQINFTGNLDRDGDETLIFIIEEEKETVLNLSQRTLRVL